MIRTEAWVLHRGPEGRPPEAAELRAEPFTFAGPGEEELLVEPLYGCWEANMTHALSRKPVDICRQRGEERVVLGNSGVVRVLTTGAAVSDVREGDVGLVYACGEADRYGYLMTVWGYDAPGTVGTLARRTKLHRRQFLPLATETRHSLQQWAAFSLRYLTAWANWKQALGCWRLRVPEEECPAPHVWAWGGGVSLAEVTLARFSGCRPAMISSQPQRLDLLRRLGVEPVDRRRFAGLAFDPEPYRRDVRFRERYRRAETAFLETVDEVTGGAGVAIFIDNIGQPVFRATLKALGRLGVLATTGWREGMHLSTVRAIECIRQHIHVHTHGARRKEALAAVSFAESTGWAPPVDGEVFAWDEIPRLATEYAFGRLTGYFPLYQVNPP